MESRGDSSNKRSLSRPAIARRSCDQCRTRKIGCDRASPCSNCVSARLDCTHSAVATNATAPKQRVLLSAQYEQKIDGIAKGIDGITLLLKELSAHPEARKPENGSTWQLNQTDTVKPVTEYQPISTTGGERLWDHSVHIVSFVKAIVEDRSARPVAPEDDQILSSLEELARTLESPPDTRNLSFQTGNVAGVQAMPPLEAAVAVLRWAKDHEYLTRIAWISRVLPLEKFTEICRKVYFAVDQYSEVEFILANGFLYYIFAEHVAVSGNVDYGEYFCICRKNLHDGLMRLPLFLPASMEVIAALTLGAFNAIESCRATMAWTLVSAASNLCQALGYHRLRFPGEKNGPLQAAQQRLFWTVHKIDKGLSLHLGRPSNIHDSEITLPSDPNEPRPTRLGRVQGKVYDQLYSPAGLSRSDSERGGMAEALAGELRVIINETHAEIASASEQLSDSETDPMRVIYLQCDLVCQSSLLVLILRAIPTAPGFPGGASDDYIAVARETLDIHEQCMTIVRNCKTDPFLVMKYINWAILHVPFVTFSILFTRTIQLRDLEDLARLDRFAASLQPATNVEADFAKSSTHPHRLYKLLCQAARLYFDSYPNTDSSATDPSLGEIHNPLNSLDDFDFVDYGMDPDAALGRMLGVGNAQTNGLSEWYYANQQIMGLLDEDVHFEL